MVTIKEIIVKEIIINNLKQVEIKTLLAFYPSKSYIVYFREYIIYLNMKGQKLDKTYKVKEYSFKY